MTTEIFMAVWTNLPFARPPISHSQQLRRRYQIYQSDTENPPQQCSEYHAWLRWPAYWSYSVGTSKGLIGIAGTAKKGTRILTIYSSPIRARVEWEGGGGRKRSLTHVLLGLLFQLLEFIERCAHINWEVPTRADRILSWFLESEKGEPATIEAERRSAL
ncbi:hypothetical protein C8R44DRAFT_846311 [Mycena epipterygia]|nr:hypothetical protein C8R44DRAFT_846311 [Mycena epipterygia]